MYEKELLIEPNLTEKVVQSITETEQAQSVDGDGWGSADEVEVNVLKTFQQPLKPAESAVTQRKEAVTIARPVEASESSLEEDETMEESYERPSSFPAEIDQNQPPVPSEESNSMDHVENQDEVLTDGQRLELSTSSTNDLTEKDVQSITEMGTTTKAPATSKSKRIDVRNIQFLSSINQKSQYIKEFSS